MVSWSNQHTQTASPWSYHMQMHPKTAVIHNKSSDSHGLPSTQNILSLKVCLKDPVSIPEGLCLILLSYWCCIKKRSATPIRHPPWTDQTALEYAYWFQFHHILERNNDTKNPSHKDPSQSNLHKCSSNLPELHPLIEQRLSYYG